MRVPWVVTLISPPPHHDNLFRLKIRPAADFCPQALNPRALVSGQTGFCREPGGRHHAAGVARPMPNLITISGYDGAHGRFAADLDRLRCSPGSWVWSRRTRRCGVMILRGKVRGADDVGLRPADVIKGAILVPKASAWHRADDRIGFNLRICT